MAAVDEAHRDAAVARLKDMLRHPDDLEIKVNILRRRMMQEKATIDAQLKSGAQAHFDGVQRGLGLLREATERSDALQRQLKTASEQRFGTQELSQHYDSINQISRIHENMNKAKQLVEKFRVLDAQLADATGYFEEINRTGQVAGPEILQLHYRVSRLEAFRDSVMRDSQTVSRDTLRALQSAFESLDGLCEDFAQFFWAIVSSLLDYAANKDGAVIISVAKVVEAEEAADAKALELWRNEQPEPNPNPADGPAPKAWREMLFKVLKEQVENQYAQWEERFVSDPFAALEETDFIVDDLSLVFDEVVPRFPKKYKIFPFFTLEYHQQLARHLARIASLDLDAGQILRLLRWTREYYANMKKQLGIAEKILQPKLLEGQEETLIKDYLRLVRAKLDEWMHNLVKAGAKDFSERDKAPEVDMDGTYGIGASVIIFQMINEQIEVATESNRGNILADVVVECAGALKTTQESWTKLLGKELKNYLSDKEMPDGLVDYIMALSNEQLRCVEFCESITERSSGMVNAKYAERINTAMENALTGFLDVGKFGVDCLIEVMLRDMNPTFDQLFCQAWYEDDLCGLLIATLDDYCGDFRAHMKEYLFRDLMDKTLDRFLEEYLRGPRNKEAILHMPEMDDRMQDDLSKMYDFFSQYFNHDRMGEAFMPIDALRLFVTAPPEHMAEEYVQIRNGYPDTPLWLAEKIVAKRDDIEKPQGKEILDVIKKTAGKPSEQVTTVFGRMKKK